MRYMWIWHHHHVQMRMPKKKNNNKLQKYVNKCVRFVQRVNEQKIWKDEESKERWGPKKSRQGEGRSAQYQSCPTDLWLWEGESEIEGKRAIDDEIGKKKEIDRNRNKGRRGEVKISGREKAMNIDVVNQTFALCKFSKYSAKRLQRHLSKQWEISDDLIYSAKMAARVMWKSSIKLAMHSTFNDVTMFETMF